MINLYRITDLGMCLPIKVAFTSVLNVLSESKLFSSTTHELSKRFSFYSI